MKRVIYKPWMKTLTAALQIVLAAVIALCLFQFRDWAQRGAGFSDIARPFEETEIFLSTVEDIVLDKIAYAQNMQLFERGGEFCGDREIDIRQYAAGKQDEANINLNTSYYLEDLIEFAHTGLSPMQSRIRQLQGAGYSDREIGDRLAAEAETLETVRPVSGGALADYARVSDDPSTALCEYYQDLCATARDISYRYRAYVSYGEDSEDSSEAPCNVSYYVESTSTKERFTNLGASSLSSAINRIDKSQTQVFLFVGERRFGIMAANTEYVLNDRAAQWFIDTRFLGNAEKVLLAVDLTLPAGDALQEAFNDFERLEPRLYACMFTGAAAAILLLILFVCAVIAAGRREAGGEVRLSAFDQIPTEIAAGLCLIAAIAWYLFAVDVVLPYAGYGAFGDAMRAVFCAAEYGILLGSVCSLARRIKAKTLWENSVCYAVIKGSRQIYNARKYSGRLIVFYIIFFILNIIFVGAFRVPGMVMAVVMDMAVLLYLVRDELGKQSVREGLSQISKGKLDYRIDTSVLTGESLEMAERVNEMGDGLQKAVDAIVANERLRAELITNVSHDLKTPLTSIITYVDLLRREDIQDEKAREYIEILDHKARRLKQLTEDLIEVSKISSGNIELDMRPLSLYPFLQQVFGEMEERMEERSLTVEMKLERGLYILADGRQLWRVFENLMGNAAKYSKEGSTVLLELERADGYAVINLSNTSEDAIERTAEQLEERFVRGDESRSGEGSGLGLSIARSLTELMNGAFTIEAEDHSFRVTLVFPLCMNIS